VVDERTDSSRGANNDVIVTNGRKREEKIKIIVNVFDQKDTQSEERPARELNWLSVIRRVDTRR